LIKASWVDSDAALVAGAAAFAVAAGLVFALIVASAVGAVALSAVFLPHWPFVVPAAGGPDPASAEVSGVPGPALLGVFAAAAGISGLASRCPCLEQQRTNGKDDTHYASFCPIILRLPDLAFPLRAATIERRDFRTKLA
jgi:hypothetical protein